VRGSDEFAVDGAEADAAVPDDNVDAASDASDVIEVNINNPREILKETSGQCFSADLTTGALVHCSINWVDPADWPSAPPAQSDEGSSQPAEESEAAEGAEGEAAGLCWDLESPLAASSGGDGPLRPLAFDGHDTAPTLGRFACLAWALGPAACRRATAAAARALAARALAARALAARALAARALAARALAEGAAERAAEAGAPTAAAGARAFPRCPAAEARRLAWRRRRRALGAAPSATEACALPAFEPALAAEAGRGKAGPEAADSGCGKSACGAHWTARPVGSCRAQCD
jgi:hypothetical protein